MKNSTRAKSSQQEKRIAKAMGGKQVIGSGSTPFLKGDVVVDQLFIEAKTKMVPSQQITVKKAWIDKAKEQALSTRKRDYAVAISFGDPKEYYIIEDTFMEELFKSREALTVIEDYIANYGVAPSDVDLSVIDSIIKEVYTRYSI